MRACEGCRRRKIKCDAATTNTWPCSACIRLKLHCVPPTVNYDSDFSGTSQGFEGDRPGVYESNTEQQDEYHNQIPLQQHMPNQQKPTPHMYPPALPYNDGTQVYQPIQQPMTYSQPPQVQQSLQFDGLQEHNVIGNNYTTHPMYQMPPLQQQTPQQQSQALSTSASQSPDAYQQEEFNQQDLAELLGDLKMDAGGRGKLM